MARHAVQELSSGWEFKSETDTQWRSVSRVPSNVHVELIQHGLIPHPFPDTHELDVAWVGEQTWHYRTSFTTPAASREPDVKVDLVFEGLDTFATVTLNGKVILQSDNMFVEHRVGIGEHLAGDDGENKLEIVFEPARRRGLELVKAHPEHDFIVHQTEVSRGPVRKAQYHWGWDWGPILLTCGPWRPVRLETYVSRIEDVRLDYQFLDAPSLWEDPVVEASVHANILGPAAQVEVELLFDGEPVVTMRDARGDDSAPWQWTSSKFKLENPQLWWPRGYGDQNLYELRVRTSAAASDGGSAAVLLAEEHRTVGFRKAELVQEKDGHGQSFYFRINGVDVFAGGSCWIPADSFLPQISPQRYHDWIALLAEGNQNMVRVWGGGVYEPEPFYAACDELGVMVWQDFMFACASYPTYPEFLRSVETEARQNVRRLRHHPSIVLWCGNNEDYQLVERYGLEYDFATDKDPQSWLRSTFPARYIYEHLLPRVAREESPGTAYHPGSPWGDGTSTTLKVDPTVGDIHQWELWNGEARPWQLAAQMGGRFVSEFGMPAYPHADTVRRFVTCPDERRPGSATLDFHTKAVAHARRLFTYLGENFRVEGGDLDAFVHLTQVLQADAVAAGYRSWRRHWGGGATGRRCGGVLVWQLNDCWPAVSWAVADYFLVRKPAWYAIRRALQPVAVGVARKFHDWTARPADGLWRRNTGHIDPWKAVMDVEFDAWVVSSSTEPVTGNLVVRFVSIRTGEEVGERIEREVQVRPNGCTEVLVGCKFDWDGAAVAEPEHFVIQASLWVDGEQVSSDTSWPDPLKYLDFSDRGVRVSYISQGLAEISVEKPVKGFVFAERQGVEVSDNGFDLIPGDQPKLVRIEGEVSELPWTFVGR